MSHLKWRIENFLSPERSAPVSATGVQVTSAHPEARALCVGPHDKLWSDKATGQGTQDVVGVGVLLPNHCSIAA